MVIFRSLCPDNFRSYQLENGHANTEFPSLKPCRIEFYYPEVLPVVSREVKGFMILLVWEPVSVLISSAKANTFIYVLKCTIRALRISEINSHSQGFALTFVSVSICMSLQLLHFALHFWLETLNPILTPPWHSLYSCWYFLCVKPVLTNSTAVRLLTVFFSRNSVSEDSK